MTMPGGPTRPPRPSRATRMVDALKKTGEHRYTEGAFAMMGLALLAADLYALLQHPAEGIGDQIFHGVWALVAIAFIPGAVARVAGAIREVGTAAGNAWKGKDKDGGGTP